MLQLTIGVLAGAVAISAAEHKYSFNAVDVVLNWFRSEEAKLKLLEQRSIAALKRFRAAVGEKL